MLSTPLSEIKLRFTIRNVRSHSEHTMASSLMQNYHGNVKTRLTFLLTTFLQLHHWNYSPLEFPSLTYQSSLRLLRIGFLRSAVDVAFGVVLEITLWVSLLHRLWAHLRVTTGTLLSPPKPSTECRARNRNSILHWAASISSKSVVQFYRVAVRFEFSGIQRLSPARALLVL
jgi:hypothetical protein